MYKTQYPPQSASNLQSFAYTRNMGAFRPSFKGIPEQYHPLNKCETFMYAMFVLATIVGSLALMIGLLFWVTKKGLSDFVIVWSIVFLVFIFTMIIAFYFGGKSRIRQEKRLIVEQQQKQQKMRNKDNMIKQMKNETVGHI